MFGKYFIGVLCLLLSAVVARISAADTIKCDTGNPPVPDQWIEMNNECERAMREQIQHVVHASYVYMASGVYFTKDTVNRPNLAIQFYKDAKDKRQRAFKLIDYLSMRGKLTNDINNLIKLPEIEKHRWESAADALQDALQMETELTKSIRKLIQICERRNNDFHLIDYLSGVYLEEQLKRQRELAGQISTLKKMMVKDGALGEFLFDKDM